MENTFASIKVGKVYNPSCKDNLTANEIALFSDIYPQQSIKTRPSSFSKKYKKYSSSCYNLKKKIAFLVPSDASKYKNFKMFPRIF